MIVHILEGYVYVINRLFKFVLVAALLIRKEK
jgi:hypothetical protein